MSEQNGTSGVHKTSLSEFIEKLSNSDAVTEAVDNATEQVEDAVEQPASEEVHTDFFVSEDEAVKVPLTAKFKVGEHLVAAKDVFNAYETRENISRRFTELDKKEKRLLSQQERIKKEQAELDYINEKFGEVQEQILEGNNLGAMQILLSMHPDSKEQTFEKFVEKSVEIARNFTEMTEEEQQLFLKKEKLAHQERTLKKREAKQEATEADTQLRGYYENVLNTHNITDQEMQKAFEDIENDESFYGELVKKDKKDRIDYVTSWVLGKRFRATIAEGIKRVDPGLAADSRLTLALIETMDPRYTKIEDVAEAVTVYLGKPLKKVISANGTSAAPKQDAVKTATPDRIPTEKPKAEKKESAPILRWDDLVAKYSS